MSTIVYPLKVHNQIFKNYCYLIIHVLSKEAILIDPAWEIDKIKIAIETHKVNLIAILLTHHHLDHVHLANTLAEEYSVPVRMSRIEIDYYNFSCSHLVPIDHPHEFNMGKIKVLPLSTPGHTKGAICYWINNDLFTGDTLFIEGCGLCFGKGSDPEAMFDSLSQLKMVLPAETRIYPGHSYGQEPGQPFARLLENNIYLSFTQREQFVAFRMRKNQTGWLSFK